MGRGGRLNGGRTLDRAGRDDTTIRYDIYNYAARFSILGSTQAVLGIPIL